MDLEVGQVYEGKVTGLKTFGAFIDLPNGQTGLVHISEIADRYVKDVSEVLTLDQEVKVLVMSVDGKKIGLSIRRAQEPVRENKRQVDDSSKSISFEDRLSKFMKDSNERMTDLKRNVENKRGGGSRKPF
jgi:S1 RNA binding domain protein